VTTPVLLQNNIFAGVGSMTNQSSATLKTNYSAAAPGFVDRVNYDLHPTASALVINAGSVPGTSAAGLSLAPAAQYKHVAAGETRTVSGNYDIGAYEVAASGSTTPTTPSTTWTACANEGGTCTFSGTREVRYGTSTKYVTKTVTASTACSNAVFGDPAPGYGKTCSYASTTESAPVTTVTWTACASEWGTCTFSGTRDVRYGAGTTFVSRTLTGSTSCSNAVFGDPTPGVAKSCSYSSVTK
jgi:hypothetical protein